MLDHDCRYTPTIMDGPVVRFGIGRRQKNAYNEWSAEINASRNGVSLRGSWPLYGSFGEVQALSSMFLIAHEAATAIGKEGDHDAAKAWVEKYNAGRAAMAAAVERFMQATKTPGGMTRIYLMAGR